MKAITTRAVILKTRDLGEADRLVAFFSQSEGRLTGLAKGARKSRRRFVNSLEPCSLVQMTLRVRKSLVWIEASKLIEPYAALRMDLERWFLAALVCEIFLEMTPEGEPQEKWFDLLEVTLKHLSSDREPLNVILLFILRFLDAGGYLPALDECHVCKAPLQSSRFWCWHTRKGSLSCGKHPLQGGRQVLKLDLGSLVLIDLSRKTPLDRVWRHRFAQDKRSLLFQGLADMISAHTGKDLNCFKMVQKLCLI